MKYFIRIIFIFFIISLLSDTVGYSLVNTRAKKPEDKSKISVALGAESNGKDQYDDVSFHISLTDKILILSAIIIAFMIGGFISYFLLKRKVSSILREEKYSYYSEIENTERFHPFELVALIEILKIRKDKYKKESEQLKKDIDEDGKNIDKDLLAFDELKLKNQDLERQILELEKLNSDSSVSNLVKDQVNLKSIDDIVVIDKGPIYTYFTIPENDGSFSIEKGDHTLTSKKFYKVESEKNSDYGHLFFLSGDFDVKAINNIDFYLIPVCEVENLAISNTATKIMQVRHGTVVKIADKWVIDTKVKVKLI